VTCIGWDDLKLVRSFDLIGLPQRRRISLFWSVCSLNNTHAKTASLSTLANSISLRLFRYAP